MPPRNGNCYVSLKKQIDRIPKPPSKKLYDVTVYSNKNKAKWIIKNEEDFKAMIINIHKSKKKHLRKNKIIEIFKSHNLLWTGGNLKDLITKDLYKCSVNCTSNSTIKNDNKPKEDQLQSKEDQLQLTQPLP